MKAFLDRLHARVGDLWWYSAMLFVACRSGDAIQAFIGLWLVPKYVGPNELGAVLPLQQLSSFFTIPLAIVAVVFSKYVNTYATRGERGKVKSFIHDVILVSAALFLVCIAVAYFLIPHFYSRLNIAAGSLTILVLASGFVGNISGLFSNALQGLKKFKTMTVQNLISAPIRLVTLLVAMPFRPLSGYLLGQTTPSASCGILAACSIRKDLKDEPLDTTWRKDLPEIWRYLWPYAICTIVGSFAGTVTATIYRQRLPEIESSAYYLLTRFSDISSFIGSTLSIILFPMASEAHERGKENRKLLLHSILGTMGGSILLAVVFSFVGHPLLSLNTVWQQYQSYAFLLPILTFNVGLGLASIAIANYELACHRIGATVLLVTLNLLFAAFLVSFTGYDFFRSVLPENAINWMASLKIARLSTITYCQTGFSIFQCALIYFICARTRPHTA